MPKLNAWYKRAEDAYQATLKQPLSPRALDRKIKKVVEVLIRMQEEYEVEARVARPLTQGELREHIHYLQHDGYPAEIRIDAPTHSSASRFGRVMERMDKMNLRARIGRSRSRSRVGRKPDEEEELSRIPHVGYRAGLMYYGRAY